MTFYVDLEAAERSSIITNEYGDSLPAIALDNLIQEYEGWYKTDDVAYIDAMVSLLAKYKAPIKGDILNLVGQLASKRLEGHCTSNSSRKKELKIRNKENKKFSEEAKRNLKHLFSDGYLWDVFTLIEICKLPTKDAYRGVAAKLSEYKNGILEKNGIVKGLSTVTIRNNYAKWKRAPTYPYVGGVIKLDVAFIEKWRGAHYPNKTKEQIKNDILGDINPWDSKYDYLGDGQS